MPDEKLLSEMTSYSEELVKAFEAEDLGEAFTPELREREKALIEQAERNARK